MKFHSIMKSYIKYLILQKNLLNLLIRCKYLICLFKMCLKIKILIESLKINNKKNKINKYIQN
jgi:hypothetical protein